MADTTPGLDAVDPNTDLVNDLRLADSGATVKATPKGVSPVGDIAMNPKQTAELLANMQSMIDERSGAFNTFMGGLKDAAAWGSGGVSGPSQALALREADKAKEMNDVYNMRQQMAALKSSSEQNEAGTKAMQQLLGGGAGGAGGAPGAPGSGQIPREIINAIALEPTLAGKKKIYTDYAQKAAQIQGQFIYNPASLQENIARVDENGRPINISPIQALYGGAGQPMPGRQPSNMAFSSDVIPAIKQGIFGQESGYGKADTAKPNYAGAIGPMQIKQSTFDDLKKEGLIPQNFDITNPQQNKAAGDALIDKYAKMYKNDPDKIAAAYYGGPGAVNKDGSINLDWRDKQNPNAPTVGQYIQQVKQRAGLNVAPAETVGRPGLRPTPIEAASSQKVQEAQDVAAATASGKYIGGKEAAIIEAADTAGNRLASIRNIEGLITNPATNRVFGVFEKPGFWNGFGAIIQSGINAGSLGKVGFEDLDKLVVSNMQGATQQEKTAAQIATREFAKMQLDEAKTLLAGQGAVSDAERGLIAKLTGSRLNSPDAIKEYLSWNRMRASYDQKVGDAYDQYLQNNPRGNFTQFRVSPEAKALRREYNQQLYDFAAQKGIDLKQAAEEGAQLNASKSKDVFKQEQPKKEAPKWKYSDEDYAAWKKSKGL